MKHGTQRSIRGSALPGSVWFRVANPIDEFTQMYLIVDGRIAVALPDAQFVNLGEVWSAREAVFRERQWRVQQLPKVSGTKSKKKARR
jgi:hypothetical protein